jgi:hypothetical protein
MSTVESADGLAIYRPPRQSQRGQLVDSLIILVLLMAVLFGVTYLTSSSSSSSSVKTRPLSALPITATEKAQFQKGIDEGIVDLPTVNQQVADNAPATNKYPIKLVALIATMVVIGGYLAFVYLMSFRQYKDVIRERFGTDPEVGP